MDPLKLGDVAPWLVRAFALVMGLLWGSFLNVVIYRVPREMSVASPPSHCTSCQTPIKAYRNIPVISWVLMRGKAPCCGATVPPRYVMVELLGGVMGLAIAEALVLPLGPQVSLIRASMIFGAAFILALALIAAAFIDLEWMIIPDSISIGGTVLGIATASLRELTYPQALLGAAVGFLVVWLPFDVLYSRIRGQVGMGMGDAKLVMLAGAWFGWPGALLVLGGGAVQGTIATIVMLATGTELKEPEAVIQEREDIRRELEEMSPEERAEIEKELGRDPLADDPEEGVGKARIAFGPFLILAILECLLIGPQRIFSLILGDDF